MKACGVKDVRIVFDQADDGLEAFKKMDLTSLTAIGAAAQFSEIPLRCVIAVRHKSSKDALIKLNGNEKVFAVLDNSVDGVFRVPEKELRQYAKCLSSNLTETPLWSASVTEHPFFKTVWQLAYAQSRIGVTVEDENAKPSGAAQPQTLQHWAQLPSSAEDPTLPSKAVAFRVTPAIPDIDGLKKAVKAEWDASNPKEPLNFFKLKVYAHDDDAGAWVEVTEPWAPLTANTGLTAYHVVVGS